MTNLDYLHEPLLDAATLAQVFDETTRWSAHFGALLFEYLDLLPNTRLLDVGCGAGFPLLELADMHGRGSRCVGVDIWQPALARAEAKRRIHGLSNVMLVAGDAERLPFPAGSFDLIVSNVGVNNFPNPQAALAECARVAAPDARLALTTNLMGHMREFYALFREILTAFGNADYLARLDANEQHRGTRDTLMRLVTGAGFSIERLVEERFTLRYLDGSAFLRAWLMRVGFMEAWRAVVNSDDEAVIFSQLEARLNDLAQEDGELRVTVPMLYLEARR